jgi:hypothetical protein
MQVIHKYELFVVDKQRVYMFEDAKILCVQVQNGEPYIWAQGDPGLPLVPKIFRIFGTGRVIINNEFLVYVGTIQVGRFVWHVYEDTKYESDV